MVNRDWATAFPNSGVHANGFAEGGLTIRQYYQAAALQGITANPNFFGSQFQQNPQCAAGFAVECADAILAMDETLYNPKDAP